MRLPPPASIAFLLSGFCLGSLLTYILTPPADPTLTQSRLPPSDYRFINPLLECDTAYPLNSHHNLSRLRDQIETYIEKEQSQNRLSFASVYYRDLNNGPWFGINEKEKFAPASLIKVPLMITYYKAAESNPSLLSQTIVNKDPYDYQKNQNFPPQSTVAPNTSYLVSDLIDKMIAYSDNGAYFLLLNHLGTKPIDSTFNDLGLGHVIQEGARDENVLLVKEYAGFFRILYNSSYLSKDSSEAALKLLSQTQFDQGIKGQLPKDLVVAHKFGERQYVATGEKQLHDCGIVYLPQKPYLVCIMTRGHDFNQLSQNISQISSYIYQTVSANP